MYIAIGIYKKANLETYRDDWQDNELIRQAYEEFSKYKYKWKDTQNHLVLNAS